MRAHRAPHMPAACSVARIPVSCRLKKELLKCLCSYSEIEFEFELLKLSCPPALAVSAWGGCSQVSQPSLSLCRLLAKTGGL